MSEGTDIITVISAPLTYLTMPSLEVATYKAYLSEHGYQVVSFFFDIAYALHYEKDVYARMHETLLGSAVFSCLLFPDNAPRVRACLGDWCPDCDQVEFDLLVQSTEALVDDFIDRNRDVLSSSRCVLFHVFTAQLFPSLYIARKIHAETGVPIWLSGYHCQQECGGCLLDLFPFVERVFGVNVYRSVLAALDGESETISYPGTLDDIPSPDYSDYFDELARFPKEVIEDRVAHSWLQAEINRGCWWDSCAFCTLNCQHTRFEQKSIEHIISDYADIQSRYATTQVLMSEYNSPSNWKDVIVALDDRFPGLRGSHSLCMRASQLQNEADVAFLAQRGASVLVGVEHLSSRCLDILNKGCSVIECVQMLKYAERHGMKCSYNIICGLPFETERDLEECEELARTIWHLVPPFDLETFRLTYGSDMQRDPEAYAIAKMSMRADVEGMLLPPDMHDAYVPFFYEFESSLGSSHTQEASRCRWESIIDAWSAAYYGYAVRGEPKLDSLLYARSNEYVLELYDSRYGSLSTVTALRGADRHIYELCDQIRTIGEIQACIPELGEGELCERLARLVDKKLMMREGASFLSLAT